MPPRQVPISYSPRAVLHHHPPARGCHPPASENRPGSPLYPGPHHPPPRAPLDTRPPPLGCHVPPWLPPSQGSQIVTPTLPPESSFPRRCPLLARRRDVSPRSPPRCIGLMDRDGDPLASSESAAPQASCMTEKCNVCARKRSVFIGPATREMVKRLSYKNVYRHTTRRVTARLTRT
jgi:hypothetical protein